MKSEKIVVLSANEVFHVSKPRYNGWQTGHGAFVNKRKYNRKNKNWKKDLF